MKKHKNISWGFEILDKTVGKLHKGNVYVLAGKTCMGKTPFLLNVLHHVAVKAKRRTIFLSSNDGEIQNGLLYEILVMLNGEIAKYDLFGMNHEMWQKGYESSKELQKSPFEIYSLKGCSRVSRLKDMCLSYADLDLLIVDNVNDLAEEIAKNTGSKKDIGSVMKMLKCIAIKHHLPVIAVCKAKKKTGRKNNIPPRPEEIKKYREIVPQMDSFISMCRTETSADLFGENEIVEFLVCPCYRENPEHQLLQLSYIGDTENFCDISSKEES